MKRPLTALTALVLTVAVAAAAASAAQAKASQPRKTTIAVFGDLPYNAAQIANFDNLSASVNADPNVSLAIHLGDIKSGSTPCSDDVYSRVRAAFDRFQDPLVFTPGDNEWTDCHRVNNGQYLPTERLALDRRTFFPHPGQTLGVHSREVETQAAQGGPFRPFVENVDWTQSGVVFATLNIPGSNNDLVPWGAPWNTPAYQVVQADEVATRTNAVLAWIDEAFDSAREHHARGVALALQADMWDATTPLTAFTGYQAIVQSIATHSRAFRKPVLMLNGDSHLFGVGNPLADPTTPFNQLYGITSPVPNFTRVTVQGSTNLPSSWVKLTIDPSTPGLWGVQTVPVTF
jgi:hypothetical protein